MLRGNFWDSIFPVSMSSSWISKSENFGVAVKRFVKQIDRSNDGKQDAKRNWRAIDDWSLVGLRKACMPRSSIAGNRRFT
jgi:hypothetical protein